MGPGIACDLNMEKYFHFKCETMAKTQEDDIKIVESICK